jgi:hypothetical protein
MAISPRIWSCRSWALAGEIAFRRGTDEAFGCCVKVCVWRTSCFTWNRRGCSRCGTRWARYQPAQSVTRGRAGVPRGSENWPENAWSLFGLAQCLDAQENRRGSGRPTTFRSGVFRADVKSQRLLCVARPISRSPQFRPVTSRFCGGTVCTIFQTANDRCDGLP